MMLDSLPHPVMTNTIGLDSWTQMVVGSIADTC